MDFTDIDLLKCFEPRCSYSREALAEAIGTIDPTKLALQLRRLKKEGYITKDPIEKTWSLTAQGKASTFFTPVTGTIAEVNANVQPISDARSAKLDKPNNPINDSLKSLEALFCAIKRTPEDLDVKCETLLALGKFLDPTISAKLIEIADDLQQLRVITKLGEGMQ